MNGMYAMYSTAVQSQKALSAYFTSKQIKPFSFAEQYTAVDGGVLEQWSNLLFWVVIDWFSHLIMCA